jgi:hypothetical protein
LNCGVQLYESGILKKYACNVLGWVNDLLFGLYFVRWYE